MKISVIIPCRNAARDVEAALASVSAQSFKPHEVIVADDGSQDDSAARVLASPLAVKLLRVQFGNAAAARNAAIEAATGDWLAFLDADSQWYPHHLQQAAELVRRTRDVAFVGLPGRWEKWDPAMPLDTSAAPVSSPTSGLDHEAFIRLRLERSWGVPTVGQVLRTDAVRGVGAFDTTQVRRHDFELFMRVIHRRTWSIHPVPSWWSRPPRAGDISADDVKCRYYALRAMALNEVRYQGPVMEQVLRREARKAVLTAIVHGTQMDVRRAWQLAAPYLSTRDRYVFQGASWAPGLFRRLYQARHAPNFRTTPVESHSQPSRVTDSL